MPQLGFAASTTKGGYIPRVDQRFVVDYANDAALFIVNDIAPVLPVERQIAKYVLANDPERFRITDVDGDVYPYGSDNRPNRIFTAFAFEQYNCVRHAIEDFIDRDEAAQTDMPALQDKKVRTILTNLNLRKMIRFFELATNTATWPTDNTSAGGTWVGANTTIQTDLATARKAINNAQFGTDRQNRLRIIMDVDLALDMAATEEVQDFYKGTPSAPSAIQGGPDFWSGVAFGLPAVLFGYETMVVNSRYVANKRGATEVATGMLSDQEAVILTVDTPSVDGTNTTFMCPTFEDFVIEEHDDWYRRKWLAGYANYDIVASAPMSGYYFSNVRT